MGGISGEYCLHVFSNVILKNRNIDIDVAYKLESSGVIAKHHTYPLVTTVDGAI